MGVAASLASLRAVEVMQADAAGAADVRIFDNAAWRDAAPVMSVVTPCYRYDVTALLLRLDRCKGASSCEVVIYDDGSGDAGQVEARIAAARTMRMPVRLVFAARNLGRARARNAAASHARSDWRLLLDADMLPDDDDFLTRYLHAARSASGPCVVVGGYSLAQSSRDPRFGLHRTQAMMSECLPAPKRAEHPARHVYTSNVLVHARVQDACPFADDFEGWGWEDTDWALRLAQSFPIMHIDNPASHLGLDADRQLMAKYAQGAGNFARLMQRHAAAMGDAPLARAARLARRLPFRTTLAVALAALAQARPLPAAVRVRALKLWRAVIYAGAVG